LGVDSLAPPTLNLKNLLLFETRVTEPILFITTSGADTSQELRDFAAKEVGLERFKEVPIGQGQSELAIEMLHRSAKEGHWLFIQNVHLAVSWIKTLYKELCALNNVNSGFRLWITTEQHARFPAPLLEVALKITVQAAPGKYH
jgi:dynein heavy chain 2, cytosolic